MTYTQLWKTLKNYVHNFIQYLDQHPYVFIGLLVFTFLMWARLCWKQLKCASTKSDKKRIVQWFLNGLIVLLVVSLILFLLVVGILR